MPIVSAASGLVVLIVATLVVYGLWRRHKHHAHPTPKTASINRHSAESAISPSTPSVSSRSEATSEPLSAPPEVLSNSKLPQASTPANKVTIEEPEMLTHSSNSSPFHDRYTAFINQVIANTLKGQIRSKEQVYQFLVEQLEPGTGEVFEYCLEQRVSTLQYQLATTTDELKQAKATRQVRAINTLQDAWERWQRDHEAQNACTAAVQQILKAESPERLSVLIQVLDPNQTNVFNRQHLQQLAKALQEAGEVLPNETEAFELRQLASGLTRGLASFAQLEGYIISWLYDTSQRPIGFESVATGSGPWMTWAMHTTSPLPRELFSRQAQNQSAAVLAQTQRRLDVSAWVELAVLLGGLRSGLVSWFDNQPYSIQGGRSLAGVTFLEFAIIWCELSQGFQQALQLPEPERQRL